MRDYSQTFLHRTTLCSVAAFLALGCSDEPVVEVRTVEPEELTVEDITPAEMDANIDAAASNTVNEVRSADSHVHGGATLSMAVDGSTVAVELETPLYNLLGFEHMPDTDAQRDEVADAERKLSAPGDLIVFNAESGCAPDDVEDVTLFDDEDHEDDHHHDDHHDDDHHADDDHAHDGKHEGHGVHRDALVTYSFSCNSISDLRSADIDIVSAFPLMEEVEVVYLGPDTQKSFELSGSRTTTDLRP